MFLQQYREGTNVVSLDSDVAAVFRDSELVNQALRVLIKAASQLEVATPPSGARMFQEIKASLPQPYLEDERLWPVSLTWSVYA